MKEVVWNWGPGASEALTAGQRYIDLEGGIRAQKTTALCAWIANGSIEYPGMHSFLCRYTDDALTSILKPKWREYCQISGIALDWNAQEECDVVLATGSRVYLRGLKSSDDTQRYAKLRGPTIARFGVDQAEELPADFWPEIQGRLSQPGYPQQAMITPQPVNENHWIASEFPEDQSNPNHLYIRTNCYDNRVNLGDAYIEELERIYPIGSAKRRTLLEGRRGLAVKGQPVYQGAFNRAVHVNNALQINPQLPLYESWDYGHSHPCVVWSQIGMGRLSILGACMGEDLGIDQFAPIALECRAQWFPKILEVLTTGDPAGLAESSQGLPVTLKQIMADLGIYITAVDGANRPEIRDQAIQTTVRYMTRTALDGQPAFQINAQRAVVVNAKGPKFLQFLADGFEAGYVWDDKARLGLTANIRRPKKDGFYDHGANCCFSGDTQVVTPSGLVRMDELPSSGTVLGPTGQWVSYRNAGKRQSLVETIRLTFSDGSEIRCTPDHRFLTPHGWIEAQSILNDSCYIESCPDHSRLKTFKSFKASVITDAVRIINATVRGCIAWCGWQRMDGQFLADSTSTMLTVTDQTTHQETYYFLDGQSIYQFTGNTNARCLGTPLKRLDTGTRLQRAWRGITRTMRNMATRCTGKSLGRASIAERDTSALTTDGISSVVRDALSTLVENLRLMMFLACAWCVRRHSRLIATLKRKHAPRKPAELKCIDVQPCGVEDVYCLEVPHYEAFVLASGQIVHNCEYTVLAFGPSNVSEKEESRLERLALKRAQRDPADVRLNSTVRMVRRGGY